MTTLQERYELYLDLTDEKIPLSFDEWLNQ